MQRKRSRCSNKCECHPCILHSFNKMNIQMYTFIYILIQVVTHNCMWLELEQSILLCADVMHIISSTDTWCLWHCSGFHTNCQDLKSCRVTNCFLCFTGKSKQISGCFTPKTKWHWAFYRTSHWRRKSNTLQYCELQCASAEIMIKSVISTPYIRKSWWQQ